jgi:glycerol kinase
MPRYVLAIDQGTTGNKALLTAPDGRVAGSGGGEFRQRYPRPGWIEHDPGAGPGRVVPVERLVP